MCLAFLLSSPFPDLKTIRPGNLGHYIKTKSKNSRIEEEEKMQVLYFASLYLFTSLPLSKRKFYMPHLRLLRIKGQGGEARKCRPVLEGFRGRGHSGSQASPGGGGWYSA